MLCATQVDYALNMVQNGCRRALLLPNGAALTDWPVVDAALSWE